MLFQILEFQIMVALSELRYVIFKESYWENNCPKLRKLLLNTNKKSMRTGTSWKVFYYQSYYHQFYYSQELQCLIHEKMLKQHTQKNWKICRKNKGVHYLIYMILRTWYCATKICIRYSCTGSEKFSIGKIRSESNVSRDKPNIESPPRTECVNWNNQWHKYFNN